MTGKARILAVLLAVASVALAGCAQPEESEGNQTGDVANDTNTTAPGQKDTECEPITNESADNQTGNETDTTAPGQKDTECEPIGGGSTGNITVGDGNETSDNQSAGNGTTT